MSSFAARSGAETAVIGREGELAQVLALLDSAGGRLVTLTGIGGIGKTRLAAEVVRAAPQAGFDEVHALELASLVDADPIVSLTADALGLPGGSDLGAVIDAIGDRHVLLAFDNCEHLADAVAALTGQLVRACPNLRILTTSRIVLGLPGERLFAVPPLSLRPAEGGERSAAAELFLERARAAGYELPDGAPAETVERIVSGLEGIPLAIELAAARVRVLSPDEIAGGLKDHLELLGAGPRNGTARHRTMRASIRLSVDLLGPDDRALFAELSVFAGGFTRGAAEAVCEQATLDGLARLVDHSLLAVSAAPAGRGETRYRFPEFVRQYAAELLTEDALAAVQARHRRYYVGLAKRASDEHWAFRPEARQLLEDESANLRRAIEHASKAGSEATLWMASWLEPFWRKSGHFATGVSVTEAALAALPDTATPARAIATSTLSLMLLWGGKVDRAVDCARQALAVAEQTGDPLVLALTLTCAGSLVSLGDPVEGAELATRGHALAKQTGHRLCESDAITVLVLCAYFQWDHDALERLVGEALPLAEELAHSTNLRWVWFTRALGALQAGRPAEAHRHAVAAVQVAGGNDPYSIAVAEATLAMVEAHVGQAGVGRQRALDHLAIVERQQAGLGREALINAIQLCAAAAGDLDTARVLATENRDAAAVIHRGWALETLGRIALHDADPTLARAHAIELAEIARRSDNRRNGAVADQILAAAALLEGESDRAEQHAKAALGALAASGWDLALVEGIELLAAIAAAQDDGERAARYLGAAQRARAERELLRVAPDPAFWPAVEDDVRQRCGAETFAAAFEAGAGLPLQEVCDYALRNRGPRDRPRHGVDSLTPVQRRIAELAGSGLTNAEIASQVFVSRSTVKMHLSQIYAKVGVSGRVALAAALREGATVGAGGGDARSAPTRP